ncbi:type II toxin-antitoxin system VapC family toxin [Tumidithrix elongata]|uniref:type II toxin-antitoxin system VapC family toxin n=1 Tax=Tumidithrix elongata TaxID=3088357 RepID=UPI0038CD9803
MLWLYVGERNKLSEFVQSAIEEESMLVCSSIVRLELQYLYEIGRITDKPDVIFADLSQRIGLSICKKDFGSIVDRALSISWTRDVFDRLIAAFATIRRSKYFTKQGSKDS